MVAFDPDVDALTVRGLVRRNNNAFLLRKEGRPETWAVSVSNRKLHLERRASETDPVPYVATYRRLLHLPQELKLQQLSLPAPRALSEETIRSIQSEVQRRFDEEQTILKDPDKVNTYLNEIGLPPLNDYLKDVSNAFYDGKKKVRVAPREDG